MSNLESVLQAASQLSEPDQIVLVARLLEAMPPEARGLFMGPTEVEDELCEPDHEEAAWIRPQ